MELYYNVNIKMKGIDNVERYNELLDFLKNGNDVKIYNLKTEKDIISFHTENDNAIYKNLNVGVSKFTKKYSNNIVRISTALENSVCYEPNPNFGYYYAKNGSIGLYYRSKYKPLYIPSDVKAQGITWIADKNNKLYVGKHMIEYLLKNQSEFDELNNKDEFLEKLFNEYQPIKDNLIQILNEVQDYYGYIPVHAQTAISEFLKMPMAEIYGVITFYSRFTLKPKGKYNIAVCLGTACFVKGSQKIMDRLKEKLGIEAGETTPDGKFSIEETRCVGACGLAPVFTVNGEVYGKATVQKLD